MCSFIHSKIIVECLRVRQHLDVGITTMNKLDKGPLMELILVFVFFLISEVFDF